MGTVSSFSCAISHLIWLLLTMILIRANNTLSTHSFGPIAMEAKMLTLKEKRATTTSTFIFKRNHATELPDNNYCGHKLHVTRVIQLLPTFCDQIKLCFQDLNTLAQIHLWNILRPGLHMQQNEGGRMDCTDSGCRDHFWILLHINHFLQGEN